MLGVYYALALLPDDLEAAAIRLSDAERALDDDVGVGDEEASRSLPGMIAIVHAYLAGSAGDVAGIARHAQQAWERLPAGDRLWRGGAASLKGLAHWTSGELEAAHDAFVDAGRLLSADGSLAGAGAFVLGNLRSAQGRLRDAADLYGTAIEWATGQAAVPHTTADLYVGLSEVRYEHDDIDGAMWCLQQSEALGEHAGLPENRYRWYVAMARISTAQGGPDRALDLLDEAQRRFLRSPDPEVRPVSAFRARVWVGQGRLADAIDWARARGLSVDDELSYLREFEHLTLARVLLAQ